MKINRLTPSQQHDFDKWRINGHNYISTFKPVNGSHLVSVKDLTTGKEIDLTDYNSFK